MAKTSSNNKGLGLKSVAQIVAQTEHNQMLYMYLRGTTYWFRRRAPAPLLPGMSLVWGDLKTTIQKDGYVKFSLKTHEYRDAAKLALKYAHYLDQAAERRSRALAASKGPEPAGDPATTLVMPSSTQFPSRDEIEYGAEWFYVHYLCADAATEEQAARELLAGEDEAVVRLPDHYLWTKTDLPPATMTGQLELLRQIHSIINFVLLTTCGKQITEVTAELMPFAHAYRRYFDALEKRRLSEYVPTPELRPAEKGFRISNLYEKFVVNKTNSKVWKRPVHSDKHDYRPIIDGFIAVVGDKPISKLTKADARAYYDSQIARTDISTGTKKRNFDRVKALLRFGASQYEMQTITELLVIAGTYKRVHQSYERFSHKELKALFESKDYLESTFKKPSQFWLPMLGLYTGARIAELAGLELDKISTISRINCYYLSHPKGANMGGKNSFAPRWVPIHPELIRAGFLRYVSTLRDEGFVRLFPCLGFAQRDGYGKRATDDFTTYRRTCQVGKDEGAGRSAKTYHSFRSTFISELLERGVDGDVRRALVGHASQEVFPGIDDKSDAHEEIYSQSTSAMKKMSSAMSRVNFKLAHAVYVDTPAMKQIRARAATKSA